MKQIVFIFFLLFEVLYSQSNICKTQWIQMDGKKYTPMKSVEVLEITFINELDSIKLVAKNQTTVYNYKAFLNVRGQLGISYKSNNGNLLDLFQNGTLMIWKRNTPMLKAQCPTLKLDITKNSKI